MDKEKQAEEFLEELNKQISYLAEQIVKMIETLRLLKYERRKWEEIKLQFK